MNPALGMAALILAADPPSDASQGPNEGVVEERSAMATAGRTLSAVHASTEDGAVRPEQGSSASADLPPRPTVRAPDLQVVPPKGPHLLDHDEPGPDDEPPVQWIAQPARLSVPVPVVVTERSGRPVVTTELGLRGAATLWGIRVWADSLARVDASASERDRGPRLRITGRRRIGVDAEPTERVHLGVVVSRTGSEGVEPLPRETRASATLRFGF